jgi:hypothetical protein
MSRNVEKNLSALRYLRVTNSSIATAIVRKADDSLLQAVCEIAENLLLNNRLTLPPSAKKQLAPFKQEFHHLISPKVSLENKRKLLLKTVCHFLPILLAVFLKLLGEEK